MKKIIYTENITKAIRIALALENKEITIDSFNEKKNNAYKYKKITVVRGYIEYHIIWEYENCYSFKTNIHNKKPKLEDISVNDKNEYILNGKNIFLNDSNKALEIKKIFSNSYFNEIIFATDFSYDGDKKSFFLYDIMKINNIKNASPFRRATIKALDNENIIEDISKISSCHILNARRYSTYARAYSEKIFNDNVQYKIDDYDYLILKNLVNKEKEKTFTKYYIEINFNINGNDMKANLLSPQNPNQIFELTDKSLGKKYMQLFSNSKGKVIDKKEEIITLPSKQLFNTKDLLITASRELNLNAKYIYEILKLLYNNGYITFYETKRNKVNNNDYKKLYNTYKSLISKRKDIKIIEEKDEFTIKKNICDKKDILDTLPIIPTKTEFKEEYFMKSDILELNNYNYKYTFATDITNHIQHIKEVYNIICERFFSCFLKNKQIKKNQYIFEINKNNNIAYFITETKSTDIDKNININDKIDNIINFNLKEEGKKYCTDVDIIKKMCNDTSIPIFKVINSISKLTKEKYINFQNGYYRPDETAKTIINSYKPIVDVYKYEELLSNLSQNIVKKNGVWKLKSDNKMKMEFAMIMEFVKQSISKSFMKEK